MKDVLLCTVGKSFLINIKALQKGSPDYPLKELYVKGNWLGLIKAMLQHNPEEKILGAEINSTTSLLKKGFLDQRNELYLLCSDTEPGKDAGEIIKSYYEDAQNPYRFERVLIRPISGLRDDNMHLFKTSGLKNLIKEIARIVMAVGSERIIINATAGYKAQASFAALIGQALEIPVLYKFETFDEIIELPPQPLSLNFDFWLFHYNDFYLLAHEEAVESDELFSLNKDIRAASLIETRKEDNKSIINLSPMGQLFYETFSFRFHREKDTLIPKDLPEIMRKPPSFPRNFLSAFPLSAKEFVEKIWQQKRYIKTISPISIEKSPAKFSRFIYDQIQRCVILIFSDINRTARFKVEIPEKNELRLQAATADLNQTFFRK